MERGLGPLAILVLTLTPNYEAAFLIYFFCSSFYFNACSFLYSRIYPISFSLGKSFCLACCSTKIRFFFWTSSNLILWSGPKYINGQLRTSLNCLLSSISWVQTMYFSGLFYPMRFSLIHLSTLTSIGCLHESFLNYFALSNTSLKSFPNSYNSLIKHEGT